MDTITIDLFTVVVAAILNMVIGFVWYSKWLFEKEWFKFAKLPNAVKHGALEVFYGFVVSFIIAYFIAFFQAYLGITSVTDGMFVGFCLWLGFVATTQISPVIWAKSSFRLFFIDTGYKLLSILVMSGVIGA